MIEVPLRVVREYPDDALTWHFAHEVSHYRRHEGRRLKDRLFNLGLIVFGAAPAAGTLWFVVNTFLGAEPPTGGIFVVLGCFLYGTDDRRHAPSHPPKRRGEQPPENSTVAPTPGGIRPNPDDGGAEGQMFKVIEQRFPAKLDVELVSQVKP